MFRLVPAFVLCLAPLAFAAPEDKPPEVPKDAAAVVNGEAIPEAAIQRILKRVPESRRAAVRTQIVTELVNRALLDQHAKAKGHTAKATQVSARIEEMKAELKKQGKDFKEMLEALGYSEDDVKKEIALELRWTQFADTQATDKALEEHFNKNKSDFDGSTLRASHILLDKTTPEAKDRIKRLGEIRKAVAKEVAEQLQKLPEADREKARGKIIGEAFGKYAKDESVCPSKAKGGDLGFFPRTGAMVQPFADAAYATKTNEMSDVVETRFGHHLILVTERKAGKPVKMADVKEAVKEAYLDTVKADLLAQLRKKATIVIKP